MDLQGHPVNFCLFCLHPILPYIVVPQSEAGESVVGDGLVAGEETSDSSLLVTPIIPNFKRLCSYLGIKFPSEQELLNDSQSIVGGGESIFSATCDKFLCLTCFERVDYLRLLYNQMEDIRGKIKNAAQVIKDFVMEKTNVVGTFSTQEGCSVPQLEFIKVLENHVKQVTALSTIWRGTIGGENLVFIVDRDELHVRDETMNSECNTGIPKIETTTMVPEVANDNANLNEIKSEDQSLDEERSRGDNTASLEKASADSAGKIPFGAITEIHVDGKKIFQCSHCMKTYERLKSLRNHIAKAHSSTETASFFTCRICDSAQEPGQLGELRQKRRYANEESLKKHIFFKHTTGPKYKCEQCSKRYYSNQQLRNHVNTEHKGIRYSCSYCSKLFTNKSHLKRHEKLDHTREGLYQCTMCSKTFTLPGDLKRHMILHDANATKDHVCDVCGKTFLTKTQLTAHIYDTHQSDRSKRFQCTQCPAKFRGRLQLKYHENTHSGEKPFKCPVCEKCFAQKSQVNKHVKVMHEQVPKKKGRKPKTNNGQVEDESNSQQLEKVYS